MVNFEPIDQATFDRQAVAAAKRPTPFATKVGFDRRHRKITLELNTGIEIAFDPRDAYGLEVATESELASVRIEGAGSAIHFERLDAYFSVSRLLEGFLGPIDWTRREVRAAASRRNGKLGGRPRKLASTAPA